VERLYGQKNNEIQTVNVKIAAQTIDGERLGLPIKELGSCEVYPQSLRHNSNGRFVVVCGDGEYIIYTALAWRNKSFGTGLEFVWANGTGEYGVRESTSKVKIFKNFKENPRPLRTSFSCEGIFGGVLLGVRSNDFVCFYDWEECRLIRKINVLPKAIYWSETGDLVSICCESSFYILKYNKDAVSQGLEQGATSEEEGAEAAFEVLHEIGERVRTAIWVDDCFIYTNANSRLNYCVGGQIVTISHLDRQMYLLGYLPRDNRLYLIDKGLNVVSYSLHQSIINYQTAVIRGDMETAAKHLIKIPKEQRNSIAQFLESQGYKLEALQVSIDPDHRFDLAIQLGKLDIAEEIAKEQETETKWKQLGDLALTSGQFPLAEKCLQNAGDLGGLFLLYSSLGHGEGLKKLSKLAAEQGKNNIAFLSFLLLGQLEDAVNLLCNTSRIPEAAFFARTYLPSHISKLVKLWREDLQTVNVKAAESLADPMEYENLFPDLQWALKAEERCNNNPKKLPASFYLHVKDHLERNLIQELKENEENERRQEANLHENQTSTQHSTSNLLGSAFGSSSPLVTRTLPTSAPASPLNSSLTKTSEPESTHGDKDMESEVDLLLQESSVELDPSVVDADVDDILKNETLLQE